MIWHLFLIFSFRTKVRHYYPHLTDVETKAANREGTCHLVREKWRRVILAPNLLTTSNQSAALPKKGDNCGFLNNFSNTQISSLMLSIMMRFSLCWFLGGSQNVININSHFHFHFLHPLAYGTASVTLRLNFAIMFSNSK